MPTWRLIPPSTTYRYPVRGSLVQELVVEQHVAGNDVELSTYPDGAEIPEAATHVWLGGHINTTTDPAVRGLWIANGFDVQELSP